VSPLWKQSDLHLLSSSLMSVIRGRKSSAAAERGSRGRGAAAPQVRERPPPQPQVFFSLSRETRDRGSLSAQTVCFSLCGCAVLCWPVVLD